VSRAVEYAPGFKDEVLKLCGRNPTLRRALERKMAQILLQPLHYKPLRAPLRGKRRVLLAKSFVLIFEVDSKRLTVRFLSLTLHDKAYGI
jgi:mRNA-degrading endonuclease RelE of RelBE toxin-antitoxin system